MNADRDTQTEGELERLRAELAEARAALTELAPADEVLVEGSYFQRADLPRILRNYMRTSADHAREAKEEFVKRQSAEAALTRVRELADWFERQENWRAWNVHGQIRAALDPASDATRPSPAPADDEGTRAGSAPSEGHSEAQGAQGEAPAQVARALALIDRWDGEIGAQEDHQHPAAVRAVEACLNDLRAALYEYDHPGCCTCCGGAGQDISCAGMCWDCRGTGHPHEQIEDGA